MSDIHQKAHSYYENIEFDVTNSTTDYDVDTSQATFLTSFGAGNVVGDDPTYVAIRTNQTITVKLNKTTNHAITIASTDSPFVIAGVKIRNLFITNASGSTAAIKLLFLSSPY